MIAPKADERDVVALGRPSAVALEFRADGFELTGHGQVGGFQQEFAQPASGEWLAKVIGLIGQTIGEEVEIDRPVPLDAVLREDGVMPLVDIRFKGPCPAYDVFQTSRAMALDAS